MPKYNLVQRFLETFAGMAEEHTQQRRLAAIMAADVVGYSRLMEQDEAGTLAVLRARRKDVLDPLVAKHHGRILKPLVTACWSSSPAQLMPYNALSISSAIWPQRTPSEADIQAVTP